MVCDRLVAAIEGGDFDLIICNFANPDMVGHTGVMAAAVRAVETVDHCLGRLEVAIAKTSGRMLVTADHGNIEQMRDPAIDGPHTSHTTNLVPALLIGGPSAVTSLRPGRLADVAPTILALMGLAAPSVMTGNSLLVTEDGGTAAVAAE
jgi:2,3-bisphosphoglycerate-independent phosphoglycerate mutase